MRAKETNVRTAQRMGERLQLSNENMKVINAMAQMRRQKQKNAWLMN